MQMHSLHVEWTQADFPGGQKKTTQHIADVHHNSDWSGNAIVIVDQGAAIEVPGALLKRIAAQIVGDLLVREAEAMGGRIFDQLTK